MYNKSNSHQINYGVILIKALLAGLLLWIFPIICGKSVDTFFPYISKEDIPIELIGLGGNLQKAIEWCPSISPMVQQAHPSYIQPISDVFDFNEEIFGHARKIQPGGIWLPHKCWPKFEVSIILPYRNRTSQLKRFLSYMHPFLQNQNLFYRIFVIEQLESLPFNRGKLFNIGFKEAIKMGAPRTCFIFHDVDLLPQNEMNIYACTHQPRHMTTSVNTFRYHLPYRYLFGGANAVSRSHFEEVNGFSNRFNGWGGEDDNLAARFAAKGLSFVRFSKDVACYVMMSHRREVPESSRWEHMKEEEQDMNIDGLADLKYTIHSTQLKPLHTHISVSW